MYGKKSPAQKRSCYKMTPKSPILKALKGNQHRLPEELKAKILASPAKKYVSDAQRKAVHASKADGGKGAPTKMYGKESPAKMYKNKRNKSNKPCTGCKSICPSCRGKK